MSGRPSLFSFLAAALCVGCVAPVPVSPPVKSTRAASSPARPPATRAGFDGSQRLGRNVIPLGYALALKLDPAQDHFTGRTTITLRIEQPTQHIDLHASELEISQVSLHDGTTSVAVHMLPGPNAGLTLLTDQPIQGNFHVDFEYTAPLDEVPEAVYRVNQHGTWYTYTQFEALMARHAFPCFDEPAFKTPFRIQIEVPKPIRALSNAPVESVREAGATHQTFVFAPTAPMPTYLVAFATGPFASLTADVDARAAGLPQGRVLPHNVYTVAGKEQLAHYAGSQTAPILGALTSYFGSPYPYAKLDQLGVPTFMYGAMENVGLVTYRENILLLDDVTASHHDRAVARSVMAHELAHMWFGNLVTPEWWDDIWLNEAFATWMSNKVLGQIAPELEAPLQAVAGMLAVMQEDALSSATPIRKVIATTGDIDNAFDGITYEKGFAVLRMLETWIGEANFQRGVRAYLERHAWGNAKMADFMKAIGEQTSLPVERVAKSFIEQPGTPVIDVQAQCTPSTDGAHLTLHLKQDRYVPLGINADLSRDKANSWSTPVCLRLLEPKGAESEPVCTLFETAEQELALTRTQCPVTVYPNAGEAGYYHYKLGDADLLALSTKHFARLGLPERLALPAHALALLQSGDIELSTFADVLESVASDHHRLVVEGVISGLERLNTFAESPELSEFVKRLLTPHARRIGLFPKAGEPPNQALLRHSVFSALGRFSNDPLLIDAARKLLDQFRRTPHTVPLETLQTLLPIAARHGDAETHAALVSALTQAPPGLRAILIESLGSFTQPELLRNTYELLLNGTIRPTERWGVVGPAATSAKRYAVYFEWYVANEPKLLEVLGVNGRGDLPWDASHHCTKEGRALVAAHFADIRRFGNAAANNLAQALETIDRCVALRERFGGPAKTAFN
jgi:alanyl aminopeptidase